MNVKKFLSSVIVLAMLLSAAPVFSYELPHDFWALNDNYGNALSAKDYANVVLYGGQVIDLISKEPSNEQTDNIMGSRLYDTAFACFYTGNYVKAAEYFNRYIAYGEKMGWTDGVRIAKGFVKQLTPRLSLYEVTNENQKYYGAKNEPQGVLYGQVSEKSETDDSMILLYLEYGHSDEFDWAKVVLNNAREQGKAVELALNFPSQGSDARNISSSDSYLSQLNEVLSQYTSVPIFLRIGAEVNIWDDICTPDEFKNAFCTIAASVKNLPNISVVFSVAHTDPWQNESRPYTTDDYYPGDDIVDYVGITIYCNRYFEGRTWEGASQFNEICFKTGYSADPVLMIEDYVAKYGGRKPVIISECGSAYYTGGSMNTYHHQWASEKLKELYEYVPMVYPQVKMIAYFNKNISYETNYYDLTGSDELLQTYHSVIKNPVFIQGKASNKAERFYKKADGGTITGGSRVCAYPHLYGSDAVQVDYYLNGEWFETSRQIPFEVTVPNKSGTLHAVATDNNGKTAEMDCTVKAAALKDGEFYDIDTLSDVQKAALEDVRKKGIINGYEDGSFRPYNTITRGEFATMICKMMGYNPSENCTFDDAASHWASKYIKACSDQGAVNGVGGNMFAPDDNVTAQQAFKIVTVIKKMADKDATYPGGFIKSAAENGLSDNLMTSDYSKDLNRIDAAVIISQASR